MSRLSIIVVEDNPMLNRMLSHSLGRVYEVRSAFDGQEALDMVEERVPDLIVSDIMMPVMDGMELLARLQKDDRYPGIPIIFITAKAEKNDRILALQSGAVAFITKPFFIPEVLNTIEHILQPHTHKLAS